MIARSTPTCMGSLIAFLALTTWAAAAGQNESEHRISTHAAIGQTIRIRGHVNYSHNCVDVIPTAISVVQAPRYGALETRDEPVRSTDPELGHGSKCAEVTGMGKVVYYTRNNPGIDVFHYDSVSGNGVVHILVTVQ
jgi:hypothetical protein